MSISKQQFIQIIQTFFQKYIQAIKKKIERKNQQGQGLIITN